MRMIGILVTVIGAVLFVGNISHLFYTFPFAGAITMAVGGAIIRGSSR